MAQKTAMKNNLIALLDQTYPGANNFFDSPARNDGSQKWVDFVHTYWHVDCVRSKTLNTFTEHYRNWCKRKGYNFSAAKAEKIYQSSSKIKCITLTNTIPFQDYFRDIANPAGKLRLYLSLYTAFSFHLPRL